MFHVMIPHHNLFMLNGGDTIGEALSPHADLPAHLRPSESGATWSLEATNTTPYEEAHNNKK